MDIQSLKVDLIHWLTEVQDPSILKQLQAFKQQSEQNINDAHKILLEDRLVSFKENPTRAINWDDLAEELDKRNDL